MNFRMDKKGRLLMKASTFLVGASLTLIGAIGVLFTRIIPQESMPLGQSALVFGIGCIMLFIIMK